MHVVGKVAAWLVVVLTIVAVVLTGQMVEVRNSWVKKATDLRAEFEKNEQELQAQRQKLRELQKELARLTLDWNRVWSDVEVAPLDVQAGRVRVSIGVEQRLQNGQTVFLFQPDKDGQGTEFVGPFVVVTSGQGQSALRPSWRFRPNEPKQWRFGKGWRVRENIPTAALSAFRSLEVAFAEADANLADRQDYLAMQQRLKREAQEHLNYRLAELHGTDQQPGLVQQIDGEERARNERLVQVDQLRRRVKAEVARFQQLLTENQRLARELQKTAVPVTANR